jgi:HK97 family phage prohead protease
MIHPKIKALMLRSKPTEQHRSPVFEDIAIASDLALHMENIRAKRKLEEDEFLVCFCVWGVRDTYGTGWVKGVFAKSIKDRGPKSRANQKIAVCWQHNLCDPIGQPTDIFEDEKGAFAVIKFDDPDAVPNAKRAVSQIRSGTINGYSFGFEHMWDKMEYEEATDTIWVKEAQLYEISPVTFASIKETHTVRGVQDFETRKMALDEQTKDFIKALPSGKQLELRQILDEHITLAQYKPEEQPPLQKPEPENGITSIFGSKINVNKL